MFCSVAKSRISLDRVAVAMSLLGVKWLGTRAIMSRSHTLLAPLILRNSVIATAADSSLAMTRSMEMISPGETCAFPEWAARIFSVRVMGRDMEVLRASARTHAVDNSAGGRQRPIGHRAVMER